MIDKNRVVISFMVIMIAVSGIAGVVSASHESDNPPENKTITHGLNTFELNENGNVEAAETRVSGLNKLAEYNTTGEWRSGFDRNKIGPVSSAENVEIKNNQLHLVHKHKNNNVALNHSYFTEDIDVSDIDRVTVTIDVDQYVVQRIFDENEVDLSTVGVGYSTNGGETYSGSADRPNSETLTVDVSDTDRINFHVYPNTNGGDRQTVKVNRLTVYEGGVEQRFAGTERYAEVTVNDTGNSAQIEADYVINADKIIATTDDVPDYSTNMERNADSILRNVNTERVVFERDVSDNNTTVDGEYNTVTIVKHNRFTDSTYELFSELFIVEPRAGQYTEGEEVTVIGVKGEQAMILDRHTLGE